MKKFNFKLETVLKYRKILKDAQESSVISAQRFCNETETEIEKIQNKKHNVYKDMAKSATESFSLIRHQASDSYNKMLDSELAKEKIRLAKRKKSLQFETQKLVQKAKDFRSIEILKENQITIYKKELLDFENKTIDDLVTSRHKNKNPRC